MTTTSRFQIAAAVIAISALAACADTTGTGGTRPVSLSFSTASIAPTAAAGVRFAVSTTPDPLVITRAQVVFSKTELERAGASCAAATPNDDHDCPDIKGGPMLVDLPVDAATRTALTVSIPAGTYDEFEGKIDAIDSETEGPGNDAAAFLAANPQFRGVSIRVEGTYNGQPFVYTSNVETQLELHFVPALVIDGATGNVTVHVDLGSWFRAADGSRIDPSTANAGGANRSIVEENIKRSFDAFEDHDRDGHRD